MLLVGVLAGCGHNELNPEIEREKFKAILKELYITEQGVKITQPNPEVRDSVGRQLYLHVLERHNVSEETFMKTYEEWRRHPKQLQELMTEMLEEVQLDMENLRNRGPRKE